MTLYRIKKKKFKVEYDNWMDPIWTDSHSELEGSHEVGGESAVYSVYPIQDTTTPHQHWIEWTALLLDINVD